jgi:hypothetical protein
LALVRYFAVARPPVLCRPPAPVCPAPLVSPGFGVAEASSFTSLCRAHRHGLDRLVFEAGSEETSQSDVQRALQSEVKEEPQR